MTTPTSGLPERGSKSRPNILVVSDLHLGEDLAPGISETAARDVYVAEQSLIEFLRHYTRQRADGRPWRLVINGDMADFMSICIAPGEARLGADGGVVRPEERDHGLGRRAAVSRVKMEDIVTRHHGVVDAMARFLAVGNRIDIITGNHDTELVWPEVQAVLRDAVVATWRTLPSTLTVGAVSAEAIGERLQFHPWFVHEPGVAWIEHGHQYDECCSYEYGLAPVDPKSGELVTNVDFAGLRYVSNVVPGVDPHGAEEWSFGGYLRLAAGMGWRGALRLARGYYLFSRTLIAEWRVHSSLKLRRVRLAEQDARMQDVATSSGLPVRTLEAIADLRRTPVIGNLWRLMRVLMLDKCALMIGAVIAMIAMVIALPLWGALLGAAATMVGVHFTGRWLDRGRSVLPSLPLSLVPERILKYVDARFVVFGHTHDPVAQSLGDGRWYFNSGTRMPAMRPGLLRSFTHVIIRHTQDGATAGLYQWRDGKSRAFTPGWAPLDHRERDVTPALGLRARPASEPPVAASIRAA
jgi:hypothetical protein